MRRLGRLGAALLAVGALATLTFAGSSAGHGKKPPAGPLTKKAIMFAVRRHAPGPHGALRGQGHHAHVQRFDEAGRARKERPASGVPAEHGRGLAHPRYRDVAGRARLHEQHVPPHGDELRQHDELLDERGPPGGHDPPVGRAGRQEGRVDGMGCRPRAQARAAGARRRLPHLHRRPRHRPQLRPARAAGAREQLRRPVPAADAGRRGRLDERSGLVQPGEADDLHARERADPGRRRLGPLHLRLDQRRDGQLQPRPDRQQRGRKGRQQGGREPDAWRVGRREAQARLRRTGRQDGRLLRQADRPQRGCVAVPALLHVRPAAERELQRARAGAARTPSSRRWRPTSRPRPRPTSRRSRR